MATDMVRRVENYVLFTDDQGRMTLQDNRHGCEMGIDPVLVAELLEKYHPNYVDPKELPDYVFADVAKKCPWRSDLGGRFGCKAVTMGVTIAYCREDSCGLFYILNITKP